MQERAIKNDKIEFLWNTEVLEILGSKETGVTGIRILNNQTNEESLFPCEGVFLAIGHKPNTELFKGSLDMDEYGYLKTFKSSMATNIAGVFACGDAQDSYYRQAITAAGTGCMAAIDAERFLANIEADVDEKTSAEFELNQSALEELEKDKTEIVAVG
jgi:thioredoxin reductase (NADPH)